MSFIDDDEVDSTPVLTCCKKSSSLVIYEDGSLELSERCPEKESLVVDGGNSWSGFKRAIGSVGGCVTELKDSLQNTELEVAGNVSGAEDTVVDVTEHTTVEEGTDELTIDGMPMTTRTRLR